MSFPSYFTQFIKDNEIEKRLYNNGSISFLEEGMHPSIYIDFSINIINDEINIKNSSNSFNLLFLIELPQGVYLDGYELENRTDWFPLSFNKITPYSLAIHSKYDFIPYEIISSSSPNLSVFWLIEILDIPFPDKLYAKELIKETISLKFHQQYEESSIKYDRVLRLIHYPRIYIDINKKSDKSNCEMLNKNIIRYFEISNLNNEGNFNDYMKCFNQSLHKKEYKEITNNTFHIPFIKKTKYISNYYFKNPSDVEYSSIFSSYILSSTSSFSYLNEPSDISSATPYSLILLSWPIANKNILQRILVLTFLLPCVTIFFLLKKLLSSKNSKKKITVKDE